MASIKLIKSGTFLLSGRTTKTSRILGAFADLLDEMLLPFIIGVSIIGLIYSIWLGVQYARSEGDARGEAKKRIINFLIGLVSVFVLLLLLRIYSQNAESIVQWVEGIGGTVNGEAGTPASSAE